MKIKPRMKLAVALFGLALLLPILTQTAALEVPKDPVSHAIEEGKALLKAGTYTEASAKFHQARIASDDTSLAAFVGLAEAELGLGDTQGALGHAEKALRLADRPNVEAEVLNLKGIIHLKIFEQLKSGGHSEPGTNELLAAETSFRAALDLIGKGGHIAQLNLATALEAQGDLEEALKAAKEFIREAPKAQKGMATRLVCSLARAVTPGSTWDQRLIPPRKISEPQPEYTKEARKARLQGVVIVRVRIDENGVIDCMEVLKGLPMGLTEAAVAAMRGWIFKPATLDGKPVAVWYNLTTNFRLS